MRKLLVSLGLVAFLVSGCANAPAQKAATPGDALPALLDAIQKTNEAGSGRMAIDLTFTSPKQTVHITGDVEYVMDSSDPSSIREHVVLDIAGMNDVLCQQGRVKSSLLRADQQVPIAAVSGVRRVGRMVARAVVSVDGRPDA